MLFNFASKYSFLTIAENLAASYIKSQPGVEYPQHGHEKLRFRDDVFFSRFVRIAVPNSLLKKKKIEVAFFAMLCQRGRGGGGGEPQAADPLPPSAMCSEDR
jgi:hypothetical protein